MSQTLPTIGPPIFSDLAGLKKSAELAPPLATARPVEYPGRAALVPSPEPRRPEGCAGRWFGNPSCRGVVG